MAETTNPGALPDGLKEAYTSYEAALMRNDLDALDDFFARSDDTIRSDASGMLRGHQHISDFRARRGGTPKRGIVDERVVVIDNDHAMVVTVSAPAKGGRGVQTQLWRREGSGWVIDVAHVSAPAPAIDRSIWRVVGAPLVGGATSVSGDETSESDTELPLAGHTVAVKDLFAVAGFAIGAGNPAYLREASVQQRHAAAVESLLVAGADVTGIAQTDEFAYSIAGRNAHYGTPPNPAVPGAISGGSTSGPAAAVALGQVSIGLGTDTGGSLRVPASYQGLWGLRTTHGAVSAEGLLPLAPSFDTVGWITRAPSVLAAAAATGLADVAAQRALTPGFVLAPTVSASASEEVRVALDATVAALIEAGVIDPLVLDEIELGEGAEGELDSWFEAFRVAQAAEAWESDGAWIAGHPGAVAPDVAGRFAAASALDPAEVADARSFVADARTRIETALAGRVLLIPSAEGAAPALNADPAEIDQVRRRTLSMTSIAGIGGLPALSVPVMSVIGAAGPAPVGLCLVGPRFSDLALIELGERIAAALA